MTRRWIVGMMTLIGLSQALTCGLCEAVVPTETLESPASKWDILEVADYTAGLEAARQRSALLLVSVEPELVATATDLVARSLRETAIRSCFEKADTPWVFCALGLDEGGHDLLASPALRELRGGPGVFVVDQAHPAWLGRIVSVLPRTAGRYYEFDPADLALLADLPPGPLTQRSLIFAVRRHPDSPQSTSGACDQMLCDAAAAHSTHQATLKQQGHHGWQARSQQLAAGRGSASEVCAESWPDQDLLDSCVDCVACWRQSAGHWAAVSQPQNAFGYDIRRGTNGIWYATGIFIR